MITKVCGITDNEQLVWLIMHKVDMVGLNFYQRSKRYVQDLSIVKHKSTFTKLVGVFVNPDYEYALSKISEHKLDMIQLHGNESPELCHQLAAHASVIKAFGVDESFKFQTLEPYVDCSQFFLFDTKSDNFGGSGKRFNWDLLTAYQIKKPFLLSGGIRLDHIDEILRLNLPMLAGIDVNSGFETSPGIKNLEKIELLLNKMKYEKS